MSSVFPSLLTSTFTREARGLRAPSVAPAARVAGSRADLLHPRDTYVCAVSEKLTGAEMEEVEIPAPAAVSEFRASRLLEGLSARIRRGRLDMYKRLLADLGGEMSSRTSPPPSLATAVGDDGPAPASEGSSR